MREPAQLDDIGRACQSLRHADTEIATLLFEQALAPVPSWAGYAWLLFPGLVAAVAAVAVTPLAWLGAGFFLYQLIAIHMRYHERITVWDRAMNSVQMMLRTCSLLGALEHPSVAGFKAHSALAGRINRSLSRSAGLNLIPGARAYLDWFLLANVRHYFKGVGVVGRDRDFLRECFAHCANLEADVALARHLLRTPACWAERGGDGVIEFDQVVHPLLDQPAALSIALHGKGAFISGQNGIGKSTLLRTIGLNLLAARAFGFCYAARATVPMLPVYASMQNEDSLLGGESLYIAELQRAKQLLATADRKHKAVYIIDEIFRGTNHLESVSAAAAVLDVLAAERLVIVSSHNLVLGPLLEHRLAPLCVALDEHGRLTLKPGLLAHTNGIALLAERGFGAGVEARAAKVFDWLGGWLAQPPGGAEVLGAGRTAPITMEFDEQS
jgi:nucleoside-triphosphatase THEP1